MGKSSKQVSEFQLEGEFIGLILKDGYKPKKLRLATAKVEYWIKLPKELRAEANELWQPGNWLQVTGESSLCRKTGKLKLYAYEVEVLKSRSRSETFASVEVGEVRRFDATSEPAKLSAKLNSKLSAKLNSKQNRQYSGLEPPTPIALAKPAKKKATILVCQKSDCRKRGGKAICPIIEEHLRDRGLQDEVAIKATGCMKRCKAGPNIVVMPDKTRYSRIEASEIPELLAKHF